MKVTLKDWNWITSNKATDSCRQQIAWDLQAGQAPLPTHARPIFVSLPAHPLSDTVVQSSLEQGSGHWEWGTPDEGPGFRSLGPLGCNSTRRTSAGGARIESRGRAGGTSEHVRLPPGIDASMQCTYFGRGWALAAKRPGTKQLHCTGRWLAEKRRCERHDGANALWPVGISHVKSAGSSSNA